MPQTLFEAAFRADVAETRVSKICYWTNSLYSTWDNQFYPDAVPGAEVLANASPNGGLELAKDYWVSFPDGYRAPICSGLHP